MKRLTINYPDGTIQGTGTLDEILLRLAAYEDTGLEPEKINCINKGDKDCDEEQVCVCVGIMAQQKKRVEKYIRAEDEGRLLILPCKVGDKAFWVPDMKKDDWILEDTVCGFIVEGNNRIRLMLPGLCMEPVYPQTHLFLTREEAEAALRGGADG